MNALRTAIALYGDDFSRVHGIYVRHGFTYTDPDHIGLARPCREEAPLEWCEFKDADAWWVELAVGGVGELLKKLPYEFPRIGWAREFKGRGHPRFYDFNKLKGKLYGWH